MKQKKKLRKGMLGIIICFAMVIGLLPGMSLTAYADNPIQYPLRVGGTQVTSANAAHITGVTTPTASYAANTNTLTLNGFSYSGNGNKGIDYTGDNDLNIVLTGVNTITITDSNIGVYSKNTNLFFSGTGSLSLNSNEACIYNDQNITIEDVTLNLESGVYTGIRAGGKVIIEQSVVTSKGTISGPSGIEIINSEVECSGQDDCIISTNNGGDVKISNATVKASTTSGTGIYSRIGSIIIEDSNVEATGRSGIIGDNEVKIEGATTVNANGNGYVGIKASGGISIDENIKSLIASGKDNALIGTVTNLIAGTGWTNTEGTEGKKNIDIDKMGQDLGTYRKVRFPGIESYPVWAGDKQFDADNLTIAGDSGTATYDPGNKTLTLNSYSGSKEYDFAPEVAQWHAYAVIYSAEDLTINLKGNNTITAGMEESHYCISMGDGKTLTIEGEGSLKATGYNGIGTGSSFLRIKGGTIDISGSNYGINCNNSSTVSGNESVIISGGNVKSEGGSAGLASNGPISVTGGTVYAHATGASNRAINSVIRVGLGVVGSQSTDGSNWGALENSKEGSYVVSSGYSYAKFETEKPAATVTTAPTAKSDLVYTGTAQELVTKGIASGGTMNYALGEDASTVPTEGWAAKIPTGTDAKKYYIWYKAVGDNTHSDSKEDCVTAEIAEKLEAKVTFKVVNGSWDKGGTEDQTVTLTGKAGDTLKLSKDQIPAVGTKPNDGYKEGGWDVTPGTETAITADTTYTYKYVKKEASPSVKFELDKIELAEGGTEKLSVTVVPEETKVSYTSSDEKVATVDENGNVTAKGEGTATITAKITVGGVEYTGTCTVTVARKIETKIEEEALTDDNISPALKELGYDTKEKVENKLGEVLNLDTAEKKENTSLSDVKLMVRIDDGEWHEATAENFPARGLAVKLPFPVTADGTQTNGEDYTFEVAHLVGTTIGDVEAGTVEKPEVTVTSDGLSTTFMGLSPVMISWEKKSPEPTPTDASITLNLSETYLTQGMEKALKATTKPEGTPVTWSSSDNTIAYVDGRGVVIGLKPGTATITATITVDGKEYSASCKVTVVPTGTPIVIPSGGGEHTHRFVWNTVEATEDADGELRYQCETCGEIQTRVPLTAYNVFNKNTTEKIRKAPKDATVKIETNKWISFHKMVMEALAERKDVTLEISFLDGEYKGNRCTVVIPKGTDTTTLVDKNGFTGFLFLGGKFGMKTN